MRAQQSRPAVDLSQNGVARYLQLGTLFRRKVATGEWPLGEQIPTVEDLADEFGVAKLTIRQALDLLERDGLIERFRAKGTFVKAKPSRELWCEVHTNLSGMLTARKGAKIEVLSERKRSALPQMELVGKPAASYRALRRRHARDGQFFLLADLYIDERLTKSIPRSAYTSKGPSNADDWLCGPGSFATAWSALECACRLCRAHCACKRWNRRAADHRRLSR
jgi:GntR family transcriptional regulator